MNVCTHTYVYVVPIHNKIGAACRTKISFFLNVPIFEHFVQHLHTLPSIVIVIVMRIIWYDYDAISNDTHYLRRTANQSMKKLVVFTSCQFMGDQE